jgi:hypothetical protein
MEQFKLKRRRESVTAAEILQWCDMKLDGDQDYSVTINVSSAKRIIEQAIREICK